jgi:hypothetical protein
LKRTVLVALLLACSVAKAAEWVSVAKSNNGEIEAFVDVSSIKVAGAVRRVWDKTNSVTPVYFMGKQVSEQVMSMSFNCTDETVRPDYVIYYYMDRTNDSETGNGIWVPIAPGSVWQHEMKFVCSWKPK